MDKTRTTILDVDSDIEDLRKNIKVNIFASGTADKTNKYYGIHSVCVHEWEIEDEAFMKQLVKPKTEKNAITDYMVNRQGKKFIDCMNDTTLNNDYSTHPSQVLMKPTFSELLIGETNAYNTKYNTKFGYNCSSLFALKRSINEKGVSIYDFEFE